MKEMLLLATSLRRGARFLCLLCSDLAISSFTLMGKSMLRDCAMAARSTGFVFLYRNKFHFILDAVLYN